MPPKKSKTSTRRRTSQESRKRLCLYLFLILIIGGLGCWISLFQHWQEPKWDRFYAFLGSMGTFAISVTCMAFADLLLVEEEDYRGTRALALFLLMAVSGILGAVAVIVQIPAMLWVAIISVVGALLEWLLVHQKDPTFAADPPAVAALGGDVDV
jgi:hypothetical protein